MNPSSSVWTVPDHIPSALVVDFDVFDPPDAEAEEYHGAFARLQEKGVPEIFWSPHRGGYWVPRRFHDAREVLTDYQHFTSLFLSPPKRANPTGNGRFLPIQSDPPEHTNYRMLIVPAFTPKAIAAREEDARALTIELIEALKPRGECEFLADFAHHVPMKVFLHMVDLPESDLPKLMDLAGQVVDHDHAGGPEAMMANIHAYLGGVIEQRRANPGSDLISQVVTAKIDGRPIETWEIMSICTLLLAGGLDTVAGTMGFIMNFLAKNPDHRRQLVEEPALIPNAVEELLRRFPVACTGRMVAVDHSFHGVPMKAGDMVAYAPAFCALDEDMFENALEVDFRRRLSNIATFSHGSHRCPGSFLARTELKVLLEEWLPRIPDFRLKRGAKRGMRVGVNGRFQAVPLEWDV